MGIIGKIIEKIKEVAKELIGLREKLRLMEVRLNNLTTKIQVPTYNIPSPDITKTLDANNIWMGEKGASTYDKMAKLDVYYDEDEEKWYSRSHIKELIDVDLDGLADGDALVWNETTEKWEVGAGGIAEVVEFTYDSGSGTWKSSGVTPQITIYTYPGKALLKTSVITDDGEEKTVFFRLPIYAEYYPG